MRKAGNLRTAPAATAAFLCALIAALAIAPLGAAVPTRSSNFPTRGVVAPGVSIAGVKIGMTEAQVQKLWGHGYEVCTSCGKKLVWLYEYRGAEPLGAAVKFDVAAPKGSTGKAGVAPSGNLTGATTPVGNGKVVAVFTLGSPTGWGVPGKAMTFGAVTDVYNVYGNLATVQCIGYTALTARVGQNTFSFYTASGVIYGFALTGPTEKACQ